MSAFKAVILLLAVAKAFAIKEILVAPKAVTIEYGELATFFCSVRIVGHRGVLYWLMNNQPVGLGLSLENDGYRLGEYRARSSIIQNSTLLINGSFYKFNNLQVQCGISDLVSRSALLRINEPSDVVINLDIISRTSDRITFSWGKPPEITLEPSDVDVLSYSITTQVRGQNKLTNVSLNGNVTQYEFRPSENSHYCSFLKFCVAPIRSAGVGEVIECINTSLKRAIVEEGPINSSMIIHQGKYYAVISAILTCTSSSLLVWMMNGQPLHFSSNFTFAIKNNNFSSCYNESISSEVNRNPVYTEYLEIKAVPSTDLYLQLLSAHYCSEHEACSSSLCFSNELHLTFHSLDQKATSYTENIKTSRNLPKNPAASVKSYSEGLYGLLGIAIALAVLLVIVSIFCTVIVFSLKRSLKKDKHHNLSVVRPKLYQEEETLYDFCGGPTTKVESLYDKPKTPSPQPPMQACEAYSTLPAAT